MAALTWDHDKLPLMTAGYDTVGGGIEGGQSLSGLTGAIDFSGGGYWTIPGTVVIGTPEQHREWSKIASYLNGNVTSIVFPFIHADFINFDPTGYTCEITSVYDVGDTSITLKITGPGDGADTVLSGMIFGIEHPTLLERVYTIKAVASATTHVIGSFTEYDVRIRPPLREAISEDVDIEFYRPACRMRLQKGTSMPWSVSGQEYMTSRPSITLIEALPLEDDPIT